MTLRWLLAAGHLLALGIGLGAVWARARALRVVARGSDPSAVGRALVADGWWGAAALVWVGTGLWRLFAGLEKAPSYYYTNHIFWTKMALFLAIVALEIAPMVALVRWRVALGREQGLDLSRAGRWSRISEIQAALIVAMVLAATAMARGFGM